MSTHRPKQSIRPSSPTISRAASTSHAHSTAASSTPSTSSASSPTSLPIRTNSLSLAILPLTKSLTSPQARISLPHLLGMRIQLRTCDHPVLTRSSSFNFSFPVLKGLSVPIQIDTWNVFNAQGQISEYDATFKWWQWTVDYLLQTAAAASNQTLPAIEKYVTQQLANSICTTAQTYCNGTNVQYKSQNDCLNFLTNEVRLGEAYELGRLPPRMQVTQNWANVARSGRNTLLCRMVHQNMVPFRPSVHCSHIGKTGGGYCNDDTTYTGTVTQNYFSNFPFGYTNKGQPIRAS